MAVTLAEMRAMVSKPRTHCAYCSKRLPTDKARRYCPPPSDCPNLFNQALRKQKQREAARAMASPYTGVRECLRCHKLFASEGPWNRLCTRCGGAGEVIGGKPGRFKPANRVQGPEPGTAEAMYEGEHEGRK